MLDILVRGGETKIAPWRPYFYAILTHMAPSDYGVAFSFGDYRFLEKKVSGNDSSNDVGMYY